MKAPTIEESLALLPNSVKVVRVSELTGFRRWVFNRSKPLGQCFGSVMAIADSAWESALLSEDGRWSFYSVTQHELKHHYQSKGLLLPLFILGYLVFPLPIGFSFRALYELGGFRQTLTCYSQMLAAKGIWSMKAVEEEALFLASYFRGSFYGWMGWLLPTKFWVWALLRGLNK